MYTKDILDKIIKITRFATDIVEKLPKKEDSKIAKTVKCVAILDSVNKKFFDDGDTVAQAINKLQAKKVRSKLLKDLFFQTELKDDFDVKDNKISKVATLVNAKKDDADINFLKYQWGTTPWISDEIFVKNEKSLDHLIHGLWNKYNGKIHVSYKYDSMEREHKAKLSTIELHTDPLLGKSDEQLNYLVDKQLKFRDLNVSRTYCLVGQPGTGKSTFAFRFGNKLSNKILRFDAKELGSVITTITPFILSLRPEVIIFDDFDRIKSLSDWMPSILTMMTELKQKFPNLIIIVTANDESKLGTAFLRPGRVDEIIDFEPPNKDDIKLLLSEYMKTIDAECSDEELEALVKISKGLPHSYIKELALRKKVYSIEEIEISVKRMKKMAGVKEEENKTEEAIKDKEMTGNAA